MAAMLAVSVVLGACGGSGGATPPPSAQAAQKPVPQKPAAEKPGASAQAAGTSSSAAPQRMSTTIVMPAKAYAFLPFFLAAEKGFYKDAGVDVKIVEMPSSAELAGLISGQVQFTALTGGPLVASLKGVPLKRVLYLVPVPPFVLLSEPSIPAFSGLNGRTIAITSKTDAMGFSTKYMLKKNHVDATLLESKSTENVYKTMMGGGVQAGVLDSPFIELAEAKGWHPLAVAKDYAPFSTTGLTVSESLIKSDPKLVQAVVEGTLRASLYLANPAHRAEMVAYVMKSFNLPKAIAQKSLNDIAPLLSKDGTKPDAATQQEINLYRAELHIQRPSTPADIEDMSFARRAFQALKSRGLAGN